VAKRSTTWRTRRPSTAAYGTAVRTVLVTGCSSGFGRATAVALAAKRWRVFASMRDPGKREALDAAARDAGAPADRIQVLPLDVTEPASIERAVDEVLTGTGGALDAVVHNAGVSAGGAFEDLPDAEVRRIFETNFFGVLALTRALLPTFRRQRRGRVVVVSSASGLAGNPALSAYCASKFAVEGWAESVAYELAPFGIDVVLVEPGSYRTDIWDNSPRVVPEGSPYRSLAEIVEPLMERRVLARARDPREVADAIVDVLEAERPRLRRPVGPDAMAWWVARGVVPHRVQRAVVSRVLGMHRWRP
jgi:NAD(P)-dependent dehydrogenase (short-subunit alcohol dehydrogenase family)